MTQWWVSCAFFLPHISDLELKRLATQKHKQLQILKAPTKACSLSNQKMIKKAVNQDRKHLYNHPSIQDKHHRAGGKRGWGKWPTHNPDHHSQKENLEIYPHRWGQSTQHSSQGVREGQEGIWNFHPHQMVTTSSPTPQCQQRPSTESELPSPAIMRNLSQMSTETKWAPSLHLAVMKQ